MKKIKLLTIIWTLVCTRALCSAQSLSMTINEANISVGLPFTIDIESKNLNNLEQLEIQGIDQFELLGTQQSSSIQVINGQQQSKNQLRFTIQASKEGKYTIGPARITTSSGAIISNTISIHITPSLNDLKAELKGDIPMPPKQFPRNIVSIAGVLLGCIGLLSYFQRKGRKTHVLSDSLLSEINEQRNHETKDIDRGKKIPSLDDPLFVENTEHVVRNYLQHIWNTNVYHLTYQELLGLNSHQTGELRVDMEALRRVLMLLQKARYAKQDLEAEAIREQMRKLFV